MNSTTCLCGRHQAPESDLPDGSLRFIPLVPGEKRPVMKRCQYKDGWPAGSWLQDAVNGGYGIGVLPWSSNLVVIDCDVIESADWNMVRPGTATPFLTTVHGINQFYAIMSLNGITTPVEHTKSGGVHIYFRQNPAWRVMSSKIRRLGTAVDVKATGLVACCPTTGYHPMKGGWPLHQIIPDSIAELPETLARMIEPPIARQESRSSHWTWNRITGIIATVSQGDSGSRNNTLNWAAWMLREAAESGVVSQAELTDMLTQAADDCGLDEKEAALTIASGLGTYGASWR